MSFASGRARIGRHDTHGTRSVLHTRTLRQGRTFPEQYDMTFSSRTRPLEKCCQPRRRVHNPFKLYFQAGHEITETRSPGSKLDTSTENFLCLPLSFSRSHSISQQTWRFHLPVIETSTHGCRTFQKGSPQLFLLVYVMLISIPSVHICTYTTSIMWFCNGTINWSVLSNKNNLPFGLEYIVTQTN